MVDKLRTTEVYKEAMPYTLTLEDFLPEKAPKEAGQYQVGEKVTRENFASFITYSFAISRGSVEKQVAFFEWNRVNTGFELYPLWSELALHGGGENLLLQFSEDEKRLFFQSFDKVDKHKMYQHEKKEEDIGRGGFITVLYHLREKASEINKKFRIAKQSFAEFRENLEKYEK